MLRYENRIKLGLQVELNNKYFIPLRYISRGRNKIISRLDWLIWQIILAKKEATQRGFVKILWKNMIFILSPHLETLFLILGFLKFKKY